jgi:hypothetical protein
LLLQSTTVSLIKHKLTAISTLKMFSEFCRFTYHFVNAVLLIDDVLASPKAVQNPRTSNNHTAFTSRKRKFDDRSREEKVEVPSLSRRQKVMRVYERKNNRSPSPLRCAHRPRHVQVN